MKLEHLTLRIRAAAGAAHFDLIDSPYGCVPLCRLRPASAQCWSAACFPATAATPLFVDHQLTGLRCSLFLLGVRDVDAALATLWAAAQAWLADGIQAA